MKDLRAWVNRKLISDLKVKYPELEGLTATGVVSVLLRKALEETKK